MEYLPNIKKYTLVWCFLFVVLSLHGRSNNQGAFQFTSLNDTLCSSHQKEVKAFQEKLTTAAHALDSAKIYNRLATIHLTAKYYMHAPEYDSVTHYTEKAIKLLLPKKSKESLKEYLYAIGISGATYRDIGHTSNALNYFNMILNITDTVQDPNYFYANRQAATTHIASFYATKKNYALAINQYKALFDYVEKHKIDVSNISSIVYMRYARFHRMSGKMHVALQYAKLAEKVARRNKLFFRVAMVYLEMAHIYLEFDHIQKANTYLVEAFVLLNDKEEYKGLLSEYYHIRSIIAKQNSNIAEQIFNAEKAFELLNRKTISAKHIELGNFLYDSYKENGDFEKANVILEKTVALEKTLTDKEELQKSALSEIERRDKNIALAQAKSKTMYQIVLYIVFLFIISVTTAIYIYKDRRKKIKFAREISAKNKELRQLDIAKSNFFSNITHELQTPLTLITGPLEQALRENKQGLDDTTKAKLKMAMKNTASLKTMVNDILDLSKLKAKKLELHKQSTDLDTFLNATLRKFTPLMKQKKLHFHFCFKNLENYYAFIDAKKLEKILNNLISNAIKYTPESGTISICGKMEEENLIVTVEDTGIGISSSDLPYIFDRYFQSKDTSKPLEGGYGIGLSLVKELVEFMNGTITAESTPESGSQFTISIPLESIHKKNSKEYINSIMTSEAFDFDRFSTNIDHLTTFMRKHTILIVEDHHEMQYFIASILQKNYQLLIASNGKEALEKLKQSSVDLIISDVMMPAMDGFTLLETLRASEAYSDIPVIMLTALADIKYKLKALTIGVDDYLTKPFIASELLARTHNILQRYESRKILKEEAIESSEAEQESLEFFSDDETILETPTPLTVKKSDTELIAKVSEIIEENIDNPNFKLNDLSEQIYLSERQLRRKIKLITGLSPKKFQQEIQLIKARTLLEDGAYSNIKAVAVSVGMLNTTRFSKLYVERFGKHPSSYFTSSYEE